LLEHEVDLMLRDIGGDFGNIHERRRRMEAFTAGWARNIEDYPGIAGNVEDRDFERAVQVWLREHNAMLIGEVVPLAYDYLKNNPSAEELAAFDHIIVDEYQDLNALEQALLDELSINANLCIAGDDDQSIYSVRYANPTGILAFLARDNVEAHSIQVCGRCPSTVLDMANSLISHAPGRNKEPMTARNASDPGRVAIVQWPDFDAEVDGIASAVATDVNSSHREPGEILVLTNWRKIGERIRVRLDEVGVPVRSFFSEEELRTDQGREAVALLRLVVDDHDAPALRVLLGLEHADGRTVAYQRVLSYCRDHRTTPFEVLKRLGNGESLGLSVRALATRYVRAMSTVERLRTLQLAEVVDELFPDGQETTADLRSLAIGAVNEVEDVAALMQSMLEAITQDTVPQNPDFVRVMSLHKSKGLTGQSVYVVGAVQGVLPTIVSDDPAGREAATNEGRRLFYVAVTRSADELVISSSALIDLADANARLVAYDRGTIRRAGDHYTVRSLPCQYLRELGRSAPRSQPGAAWLRSR
jgi:superfamily I DNA/RNA helicase